jgi:hypothetical protein
MPRNRPDAALVASQPLPLKFVVSITSVSPSQRPRASPSHDFAAGPGSGRHGIRGHTGSSRVLHRRGNQRRATGDDETLHRAACCAAAP